VLDDHLLERTNPVERRPLRRRLPEERQQHRGGGTVLHLGRAIERRGDRERLPASKQRGALDHRRKLADVARPGVAPQERDVGRGRDQRRAEEPLPGLRCEVRGEERDVLGALAQGRQVDGEDAQPVPEVAAELAARHHLRQIAVGRGDDPHVDGHAALRADALERAVLQDAQQPHLRCGRELADLIEEQRPRVGALEPALPRRDRAGEAPLLVAEELGVHELGRDGPAVHADDRARGPRRALVDGASDHLLADARLPRDEDRHVRRRCALDQLHHASETLALPHHRRPVVAHRPDEPRRRGR